MMEKPVPPVVERRWKRMDLPAMLMVVLSLFPGSRPAAQRVQANSMRPHGTALSKPLTRRYSHHESLLYMMKGINQNRGDTLRYEARARGEVRRDSAGTPFEEFQWSDLVVNGSPFPLNASGTAFRQRLSLSPAFSLSIPDLSTLHPVLFGPILDLLTFYADLQLTMRQRGLLHEGQSVSVSHGAPNSWADGTRVILGEDAIDFDITLSSVDHSTQQAIIVVRHVPPEDPAISLTAEWMKTPVADTRNNWVQVTRTRKGRFIAAVGKETFDVTMRVDITTGSILSASMDNIVEVLERECADVSLSDPGEAARYTVRRQIGLTRE